MSFQNSQWRVSDEGIEDTRGDLQDYWIDLERLTETINLDGVVYYDWPIHMAEKTWVNVAAFNEAFEHALRSYPGSYEPALDEDVLKRSLAKAVEDARMHRG